MNVILLMAVTADGKIARHADHFPDWTGTADKRYFARRSKAAGVVIMGSRTYDTIGVPLPGRLNVVLTRNASRRSDREDLWYTDAPPGEIVARLSEKGFTEAVLAGGAMVNTLFARAGLIHQVILTVSPCLFGEGLSLFTEAVDMSLELRDVTHLDDACVKLSYGVMVQGAAGGT
jgi:dihydrofolate reductase